MDSERLSPLGMFFACMAASIFGAVLTLLAQQIFLYLFSE